MNYVEAVNEGWPDVQCYANGDPNVYADIVFVSGSLIPTEAELDAYIANAVYQQQQTLTKYQFRKLYTFNERVNRQRGYQPEHQCSTQSHRSHHHERPKHVR